MATPYRPAPSEEQSIADLVTRLREDVTRIVQAEIALTKIRVRGAVDGFKAGGAWLVGGVLLLIAAFGCVIATLVFALANTLPPWQATLLVAGGALLLGGLAVLIGIRAVRSSVTDATAPVRIEVRSHDD